MRRQNLHQMSYCAQETCSYREGWTFRRRKTVWLWETRNFTQPVVILFSCSLMSDSLWPHGLQHARLPCPSPSPRACSNSCPLNRCCHPTISSFVVPSSPTFNLSQHQGLFKWVSFSHQVAKVLEFQLHHQSFQWIFGTDFLWDGLVGSPCSPMDSQESSPKPQFKSISSSALSFFIVQLSYPYMTTGKTIALTRRTFAGKVMTLLFNTLSRLCPWKLIPWDIS